MDIVASGWSNKGGTAERACKCGTWQQHWINESKKPWPTTCSVQGCSSKPTLGAHIINPQVSGERIVPMCSSCNNLTGSFTLKGSISLIHANKSLTCEKK